MLSVEMSNMLESMQRLAFRIIYGFNIDYATLLAEKNVGTLKERREEAFGNYAIKLSNSERFKCWFPLNEAEVNTRGKKKYKEEYARTKRLYDSPIYAMRRFLNNYEEEKITR